MAVRKVCVVTGTRAEYGLLRGVMQLIEQSSDLQLQLVVTGMHLSPEFGLTYREIEKDGFSIDRRVEMLLSSDTPVGIAKSTGLGIIGFADALEELQPDVMLVLGDRFEVLSAVVAAMYARIPIAHLHGGETTLGAFDEGIRHAITKMSHFHFVAADDYRRRVIQLGESPECVFDVGGLGVDGMKQMTLLSRSELEAQLSFEINDHTLLITFHPVTLEASTAEQQFEELLASLESLDENFRFVFTFPNADTDGRRLIPMIESFAQKHHDRCLAVPSLGQPRYWSTLKQAAAIVGNSSSGLLEAPTYHTPAVNIGDRQAGRLKAESVIECEPIRDSITAAIQQAVSTQFRTRCSNAESPYGNGGAAKKIVDVIKAVKIDEQTVKKGFVDVDYVTDNGGNA